MRSRTWIRFATLVIVLALLFGTFSLSVRADVTSVTLVGPGARGEDDDYFTKVWGNPRDMEDLDDLYLLSSSCEPEAVAQWRDASFSNGFWSAVTTSAGHFRYVFVLNSGWYSALDIGEDGELRPIDTSHYTQLTFRMRVGSGAGTTTQVLNWSDGPIASTTAQRGRKRFRVQGDGLWHVYTMDLTQDDPSYPSDLLSWRDGPVVRLWFQFESLPPGYRVEIDWVRLTPRQNRRIRWQGSSLSGTAQLYLGPNSAHPERYGSLLFFESAEAPVETDASAGSRLVPASLPGAEYTARVESGGSGANSSETWRFVPMPIAEITAPSYTSGEDWATTVLGNPWDMGGLNDVDQDMTAMDTIQSLRVNDGVLTVVSRDDGLSSCDHEWPHRALALNLGGQIIDPSRYRYFSYRYKADDAPDQGAGGVQRVRWQARRLSHWPTGRTDDVSFYDNGWHTYHLDLETVRQEGEMGEWEDIPADVMQIMLHESHRQWTSQLDWVKLTAENEAYGSYAVAWNVVGAGTPLTTTLYWAEKQGEAYQLVPGSGEIVSAPTSPGTLVPGGHVVYLPFVVGNYGGSSDPGSHLKSTQGLTRGQVYYIAVQLEDGYNQSIWYSELPVRIR